MSNLQLNPKELQVQPTQPTEETKNEAQLLKTLLNQKQSPKFNPDLPNRLLKFQQTVLEKIEKLAVQQQQQIMKNCTFRPIINQSNHPRPLEQFIVEQQNFLQRKKQKLQILKLGTSIQQEPKHSLCLSIGPSIFHQSLADFSLSECSFRPHVTKMSKRLVRNESVDVLLYKDAMNRLNRNYEVKPAITNRFVNQHSEKVLKEKLNREFTQIFDRLDPDGLDTLPYSLCIVLLEEMHYIKNIPDKSEFVEERFLVFKAWSSLSVDLIFIPRLVLFSFLYSLQKKPKTYIRWIQNRAQWKKTTRKQSSCTFKPSLSQKTIKMAKEKHQERIGHHGQEFLFREGQFQREQLQRKKAEKEKSIISMCKSSPHTNSHFIGHFNRQSFLDSRKHFLNQIHNCQSSHRALSVYSKSRVYYRIPLEQIHQDPYEQSGIQSFTPRIRKSIFEGKKPKIQPRGMAQAIERMQKARNSCEPKSPPKKPFKFSLQTEKKRKRKLKRPFK